MRQKSLTSRSSWKRTSKSFSSVQPSCSDKVHARPLANVLPLVNKGLTLFQWKQDVGAAERCCNEALRIDPECEAAIATLAQLNLQQGKIDKAAEMFEKQVQLARNEPELTNALTYKYVSGCLAL